MRWTSRDWVLLATLLIALAAAGLLSRRSEQPDEVSEPPSAPAGRVTLIRNVDPEFGRFISEATPATMSFIRRHFERLRGFPPFQNRALAWAPPTDAYQDLYAIYNRSDAAGKPDRATIEAHPDWVLRDRSGKALFIPFDCSGGSCPQYAADPGNEQWRRDWIARAKRHLARGYAGIFIDDVNLEMRVSDGSGDQVRPIDPRTGEEMTLDDWRRYVTEFTERVREELGSEYPQAVISHNSLWFVDRDDQFVPRQVDAADAIQLERGFNDPGLVGSGRFGFARLLAHIDYLHSRGHQVIYKPEELDRVSRLFELASYLLVSDGGDRITAEQYADPESFWVGWETDLGAAEGDRYRWRGLIRRDFTGGLVLVNPPDAEPVSVALPRAGFTPDGARIDRVTLAGRTAAVVRFSR